MNNAEINKNETVDINVALRQITENIAVFNNIVNRLSNASQLNSKAIAGLSEVLNNINERLLLVEQKTNSLDKRTTGSIFVG